MEKKKVSSFELALMKICDPEKAEQYEAFTEAEMRQKQQDNLRNQLDKMQIIDNGERKDIPEEEKDRLMRKFLK